MGPAYRQQIHTPQVHTGQAHHEHHHGHPAQVHTGQAYHEHHAMAAASPWPSPPPTFAPTHLGGHLAVGGQGEQAGCQGRPVPSTLNGIPSVVNGVPSVVNGRLPSVNRWSSDGSDDDLAIEPDSGEPTGRG